MSSGVDLLDLQPPMMSDTDSLQVVVQRLQDDVHQQREDLKRLASLVDSTVASVQACAIAPSSPEHRGQRALHDLKVQESMEEMRRDVDKLQLDVLDISSLRENFTNDNVCAKAYADGLMQTLSLQLRSVEQSTAEQCMAQSEKSVAYADKLIKSLRDDFMEMTRDDAAKTTQSLESPGKESKAGSKQIVMSPSPGTDLVGLHHEFQRMKMNLDRTLTDVLNRVRVIEDTQQNNGSVQGSAILASPFDEKAEDKGEAAELGEAAEQAPIAREQDQLSERTCEAARDLAKHELQSSGAASPSDTTASPGAFAAGRERSPISASCRHIYAATPSAGPNYLQMARALSSTATIAPQAQGKGLPERTVSPVRPLRELSPLRVFRTSAAVPHRPVLGSVVVSNVRSSQAAPTQMPPAASPMQTQALMSPQLHRVPNSLTTHPTAPVETTPRRTAVPVESSGPSDRH